MAKRLWYVALGNLSKPFIAATIHCREDVRGLRRCGWDATLYTQSDHPVSSPEDIDEVVVCKNRPIIYRLVFELAMIARLLTAKKKPSFVLFRLTGNLPFAFILWLIGIPFGVELTGTPAYCLKKSVRLFWSYHYWSSRFGLRHARVIIALTREIAELVSKIKDSKAVVVVTGVGVNCEDYQVASGTGGPTGDGPVLGFLGMIYADRGLGCILETVAELYGEGINAKVIVVGDGAYRSQAEEKAAKLNISGVVNFKGWVPPEKVSESLSECDLMVAIYKHTPYLVLGGINPMKVWTSLAIGKPVLLHNPGRFDEYSKVPGVFSCPRTEPKELTKIVAELWGQYGRDKLAKAGLEGRRYVAENVTWFAHAKVIDRAIRRALEME